MNSRTQERVERWDSRPFTGGYDALSDLEAGGFSGAVTAAGSWLFLLNGRVVGVLDGAIEDFRGASGTAYDASHPALPLLSVMEERGTEPRAKYYTNETPLREVDETLQEGSFTGYVELSENVLSGDYYAVYYGGRRMAAAYIGNAERLLTGEEAFERAADEVGIYEVFDVDLEVTDVPAAGGAEEGSTGAADADGFDEAASTGPSDDGEAADLDVPGADDGDLEDAPVGTPGSVDESPEATADGVSAGDGPTETDAAAAPDARSAPDAGSSAEPASSEEVTGDDGATTAPTETDASSDPDLAEIEAAAEELDRRDIDWTEEDEPADGAADSVTDASAGATDEGPGGRRTGDGEPEERFQQEEQWRETRSIPSIDPDNSVTGESSRSTREREATRADDGPASQSSPDRTPASEARTESPARAADPEANGDPDRSADPSPATEARAEELEEERERLDAKNRELTETIERLQSRIEDLESELAEARTASGLSGSPDDGGTQLSTRDALERTNLFVRYDSKSQPTLETAHDGDADREALASNLRLEHHTEFDAADAVVDGEPYEEALRATMEYRFVAWLTEVLIHEIRDTGHADALGGLYDAIPRIDRAELNASISLEDDDTEDVPDRVSFDVVAYDKMGNPQVVATLNDSRVPASREMLEEVEADASAVKANYPELAASIVVTSSYFEPGALEVTEEATSGGFLSRGSKLSYVNLSRKQGYHLCLVESRAEGFYMTVPEL